MSLCSALYLGTVMHRRHRPRAHKLRYRVFWCLFDLDEVDMQARRLLLLSHNRFNALSLHDADHGDGSETSLRGQVDRHLDAAGIPADKVLLLCMPRIFGYSFNPLSVYFCYAQERLTAIVYEVHNTFGERHSYLIPVAEQAQTIEQHCRKEFYVSPFMGMDMTYDFRVTIEHDRIAVAIRGADDQGPLIDASLAARATPLTDGALLRALVTHPLVTLKVIAAIHWHAMKMLLKGYRIEARPKPPRNLVTVVGSAT